MIDLYELSNKELEEMGLPAPCECLNTTVEYDRWSNTDYIACEDCGAQS